MSVNSLSVCNVAMYIEYITENVVYRTMRDPWKAEPGPERQSLIKSTTPAVSYTVSMGLFLFGRRKTMHAFANSTFELANPTFSSHA